MKTKTMTLFRWSGIWQTGFFHTENPYVVTEEVTVEDAEETICTGGDGWKRGGFSPHLKEGIFCCFTADYGGNSQESGFIWAESIESARLNMRDYYLKSL